MPDALRSALDFALQNRGLLIAAGVALLLVIVAIVTIVIGISRGRRMNGLAEKKGAAAEKVAAAETHEAGQPRIQRTKLTIGDLPSPWTQGAYERNSPEANIAVLLPAFAFDIDGSIHRTQSMELTREFDVLGLMKHCDTANGVATYGAFATLALWHCGRAEYAVTALKVISHAQMADEQRDLIRFLFQDVTGVPLSAHDVPSLARWHNTRFQAAYQLYTQPHIGHADWKRLEATLAPSLRQLYDNELARKLPIRHVYRQAPQSAVFAEGLYFTNVACIVRYMNPRRWQRLLSSEKRARFQEWIEKQPCTTEHEALLHVANPEIFDVEDFAPVLREAIPRVLANTRAREWLFGKAKMPALSLRMQFFKFFCLFARYNEAVRCYATLGVMKHDRAVRLLYARALFSSGMHHDAWSEVSTLLADFPRDAAVMNEAAIYAHRLGRYEEAAEIFGMARSLYPDDATLAYNEAVFTEQYSKKQIEEKWTKVQQLAQPPVVE